MRIEALVATMNQTDDSLLRKMNLQSDAFVVNQCDHFAWKELEQGSSRIRILSVPERGVGLSRNTALMRAQGDICLFSDDDLIYRDGYTDLLRQAFQENPKADVIVFNIHSLNDQKIRYQIIRRKRIRWFNYMRYGAARMAVRRDRILQKNLSFSLLFGGGAPYSCGEDTLFLYDCLKAGLRIYAVPLMLADIDDSSSTWFRGYTEKFLKDRGALHEALYGRCAAVQNMVYLLRHRNVWKEHKRLIHVWWLMGMGSREYRHFRQTER